MKRRRVLVTPLDWGLGHAMRCIPIIRLLLKNDCDVFLGGSGFSLQILRGEFPLLKVVELPGYAPVYSSTRSMIWIMLAQLLKFKRVIRQEHHLVERYILVNHIDFVISDNRYGCWSAYTPSVLITHQTNIVMPLGLQWLSSVLNSLNHHQIKKFDYCWIPDLPTHNFSGTLSDCKLNVRFIGPLSRFVRSQSAPKKYDLLIVLSGPEPQRSILEEILIKQLPSFQLRGLMVRGVKTELAIKVSNQIKIVNFLDTEELQSALDQSELVISRPGYSTVMDLAKLSKKAIFIPTPGQTEQEYLAKRLEEKSIAYFEKQKDFDLCRALRQSERYSGFRDFDFDGRYLEGAIDELLNQIH